MVNYKDRLLYEVVCDEDVLNSLFVTFYNSNYKVITDTVLAKALPADTITTAVEAVEKNRAEDEFK